MRISWDGDFDIHHGSSFTGQEIKEENKTPKSKISKDDVEKFIDVLREKLGTKLPDLTSIDDAIREAADECFDVKKIDVNRIGGI